MTNEIEIRGTAQNHKVGAAVATDQGDVYVAGLDRWPDGWSGQAVIVVGRLDTRNDLPVFVQRPDQPIRAGIPVPEGTDLEAASRRRVIEQATWRRAT